MYNFILTIKTVIAALHNGMYLVVLPVSFCYMDYYNITHTKGFSPSTDFNSKSIRSEFSVIDLFKLLRI